MLTRKVLGRPLPFRGVISNRRRQQRLLSGATVAGLSGPLEQRLQPPASSLAFNVCGLGGFFWVAFLGAFLLDSHLHMNHYSLSCDDSRLCFISALSQQPPPTPPHLFFTEGSFPPPLCWLHVTMRFCRQLFEVSADRRRVWGKKKT